MKRLTTIVCSLGLIGSCYFYEAPLNVQDPQAIVSVAPVTKKPELRTDGDINIAEQVISAYSKTFRNNNLKMTEEDAEDIKNMYLSNYKIYSGRESAVEHIAAAKNLCRYYADAYFLEKGLEIAKKSFPSEQETLRATFLLRLVTREEAFPLNPEAHFYLGVCWYRQGMNAKADIEFERTNELWPMYNVEEFKQKIDTEILRSIASEKD
jgi:tetratricopeptide (TPR) repeat protein